MRAYKTRLGIVSSLVAFISLGAAAQDPEAMRAYFASLISTQKIIVHWIAESTDQMLEEPKIVKWSDGEILIDRTDRKTKERKTYKVGIDRVSKLDFTSDNRLKSTTCQNVRADLNCTVRVKILLPGLAVRPVGETSGGREESLNLYGSGGPNFAIKHFPELTSEAKLEVRCNQWDWSKPGLKTINIVEGGAITDNTLQDLNITHKEQFKFIEGKSCPDKNGVCDLTRTLVSEQNSFFVFVTDQVSWFLEVEDGDSSCTVELQASLPPGLAESAEAEMRKPDPRFSNPEFLRNINRKITPSLIEEWVQLSLGHDSGFLGNGNSGVDDRVVLLNYPLLKFFDIAQTSGASRSADGYKLYLRDKFDPEAEGN